MNVLSPPPVPLPLRKPSDYPMLPLYCDAKAAADHYNRYGRYLPETEKGRYIPEEWLPTNLARRQHAMKTGRRVEYKYFYQRGPMKESDIEEIKANMISLDSRLKSSAATASYAGPGTKVAPVARPPTQPAYRPSSTPQQYSMQQMSRPPFQPQQYAYVSPVPLDVQPTAMVQSVQQRPQRPANNSRPPTASLTESDYDSYDSYDDRPPRHSHHKHHRRASLSTAGKLNGAYEKHVLENIGGAAMAVERFLSGTPKKKSSSGRHKRRDSYSNVDSYSDAESYSMSSYEEDDRRRRRRSPAPQDLRRSGLIKSRDARYGNERYWQQGSDRRSVCV